MLLATVVLRIAASVVDFFPYFVQQSFFSTLSVLAQECADRVLNGKPQRRWGNCGFESFLFPTRYYGSGTLPFESAGALNNINIT
jgi:hypothetical protein